MEIVCFCGHESLFGRQTLAALEGTPLQPKVVVAGTPKTWAQFDTRINPKYILGFRRKLRKRFFARRHRKWLEEIIRRMNARLIWIEDVNSPKGIKMLRKLDADLFICSAYPQILGRDWLDLPAQGAIGIHPSLLPAYRGAHPHFWAIRTGATVTGLTAYRMTRKIDKGEILAQLRIPLEGMNYQQLYHRFGEDLPVLMEDLARVLFTGKQPELKNADQAPSYFKNNQPEDARLCWDAYKIDEVECLLRTGIAWAVYRTRKLRILEGEVLREHVDLPKEEAFGTIRKDREKQPYIRCLDGWLRVKAWRWQRTFFRPNLRSGDIVM
ncbi:MAG: hypothetical protein GYB31_14365 [Bacteroidetes bacterium]|nr:hypothetical protein [Bacteroidota bacterium]